MSLEHFGPAHPTATLARWAFKWWLCCVLARPGACCQCFNAFATHRTATTPPPPAINAITIAIVITPPTHTNPTRPHPPTPPHLSPPPPSIPRPHPTRGNLVEALDQLGDREGARTLLTDAIVELKQVGLELYNKWWLLNGWPF
jgi:hypothetical protein